MVESPRAFLDGAKIGMMANGVKIDGEARELRVGGIAIPGSDIEGIAVVLFHFLRGIINDQDATEVIAKAFHLFEVFGEVGRLLFVVDTLRATSTIPNKRGFEAGGQDFPENAREVARLGGGPDGEGEV